MSYKRVVVVGLVGTAAAVVFVAASIPRLESDVPPQPASVTWELASRPAVPITNDPVAPIVTDRSAPRTSDLKESMTNRTDRSGGARKAAIDSVTSLADVPGEHAESILAEAALGHMEPAVREEAVHALGERQGMIAMQTLQQALNDPSPRVRNAAIRAFAAIGGDQAVLILGATLTAQPDVSVRVHLVDALGEIEGPEATRYLEQMLSDENDRVRQAAADWLAERS